MQIFNVALAVQLLWLTFLSVCSAPYRVTFVNGPLEKLCGYTANEVVGKFGLNFLHVRATFN